MNRRGFLKLASGVATAASIALTTPVLETLTRSKTTVSTFKFERRTEMFDYEQQRGIMASLTVGGTRYRHALKINEPNWQELSEKQREKLWRLLEQHVEGMAGRLGSPI